jgi:hypothetical protein
MKSGILPPSAMQLPAASRASDMTFVDLIGRTGYFVISRGQPVYDLIFGKTHQDCKK